MPASSDKPTALAEANRRYARLAVSWFAVDAIRVEDVLLAVEERNEQGQNVEILEELIEAKIITAGQAENIRLDLAPTQIFHPPDPLDDGSAEMPVGGSIPPPIGEPTQIGPYRILRRLGQGGMGAVYLGFDGKENRQVAVKVLAAEQAPKVNILRRFHLEGKHGAMLVHPNIVRSLDMGQDADTGLHYIVLEYVDGPSAHELLDRTGTLQVGDAVHIILDIARALEHAHKNQIIHRDIKPGNILLGSSGLAKLSDLGLAKRRDDTTHLTHVSQGIGTPYYMPYEQAMNARSADERSDIYALGATLYHLVTGCVPFSGDSSIEIVEKKEIGVFTSARTLNGDVPEVLDAIIARALARNPGDRYQTMSDMIVELERSHLSVALPSFVNVDSAMQDPIVKKRLTAPIEMTQPDMRVKQALEEKQAQARAIWFLRYEDRRGNLCKLKGAFAEIVARIKKGTLPAEAETSRSALGPFKPLLQWPEFQAALSGPINSHKPAAKPKVTTPSPAAPPRWPLFVFGALGAAVIALLVAAYFLTRL
ncbi:MAG TPA: serine/threonine-protein kinase [Gemmataceae bacterium]|nr:serine/threonine-protein kinase [Gemmataceae bacterium]